MRTLAGFGNLKHGVVIGVLVSRDRYIIFGFHLSVLGLGFLSGGDQRWMWDLFDCR